MKNLDDMTEPELKDLMTAFAMAVEFTADHLGVEKPRFVLLVCNQTGLAQYVANVEREGAIATLREAADRLDNREDVQR